MSRSLIAIARVAVSIVVVHIIRGYYESVDRLLLSGSTGTSVAYQELFVNE